jgi:hypothetical protein
MNQLIKGLCLLALWTSFLATDAIHADPLRQNGAGLDVPADCRNLDVKNPAYAKIGIELARLYCEYQADQRDPASVDDHAAVEASGQSVLIDATAAGEAGTLRADLEALGMKNGVQFGTMVSGQLPVSAIGEMATLDSLRFARPAAAVTQSGTDIGADVTILPSTLDAPSIPPDDMSATVPDQTPDDSDQTETEVKAQDGEVSPVAESLVADGSAAPSLMVALGGITLLVLLSVTLILMRRRFR